MEQQGPHIGVPCDHILKKSTIRGRFPILELEYILMHTLAIKKAEKKIIQYCISDLAEKSFMKKFEKRI
jgi:hypothetical protein